MICVGKRIKRYLKERELVILRQVFVNNSFQANVQPYEHIDISDMIQQPITSSIENEHPSESYDEVSYSRLE